MPNETFPKSKQDIKNLQQTATDAASDLSDSAHEHASQAKGQLKDLADNAQEEGGDRIDQVKGSLNYVVSSVRDYVADRPFTCLGYALALGFAVGLLRSGSLKD